MIVHIERNVAGPRLWICGYRVHHWHFAWAAFGIGAYLLAKDLADFREWLRRMT